MRIAELLQESAAVLAAAEIENSAIDAELLLGHCLGMSRTELYLHAEDSFPSSSLTAFQQFLERRRKREPLAYILGVQEFWSLDFLVTPDVLIPRPETEQLLERVIAMYTDSQAGEGTLVDLCCGSGAIAVVLAKELQQKVIAVDISFDALRITRKNCEKHGVSHLVFPMQSDLLSAFFPSPALYCVVSNPPYVSSEEIAKGLQPEVAQFEPHLALDGGRNGLEIIERIRQQLLSRLIPGGHIFMETGTEQADDLHRIFSTKNAEKRSFSDISVQKDYAGHDRIFHATIQTNTE